MKVRFPSLVCVSLALLMTAADLQAESGSLGIASRRADRVEKQRFEKKLWRQPRGNSMMQKRFPLQQWDKHFSSVGSKRAPIKIQDNKDKQMFRSKTFERKEIKFGKSRWNEQMADLHQKAGIKMDDRAQLVADQQLYSAMLQDAQQFRDMAKEVSLRDLNRYQFRRNRSDDAIPVEKAGSGQ